jgi:hypothetical protein
MSDNQSDQSPAIRLACAQAHLRKLLRSGGYVLHNFQLLNLLSTRLGNALRWCTIRRTLVLKTEAA